MHEFINIIGQISISTAKDRCFSMAHRVILFQYTSQLFLEKLSDFVVLMNLKSLINLKDKCFRSNLNQEMTENMLEIAKHWEDRFEPKSKHHKKNRIV